ncbi:hypothetical protein [Achromobacter sp. RTa]|uniref:hypothetical protein n=1 Tax=Achromobacter sp. RTa TaxID=1532557 RepID=UPI0012DFF35D|nr:hypothetical protein [Achromobacter sp. RTa]
MQKMHHIQSVVETLGTNGGFLDRPLTALEVTKVDERLQVDATNYLYSACVSIGDALQGIDKGLFTWSTVKLYYSTFYLLRCFLALSSRALVYDGTKPRALLVKVGETPIPFGGKSRGTHQTIINYFTKEFPHSPLLSQEIIDESPLTWLLHRREEANYSTSRFEDPRCPMYFSSIVKTGVRKSTTEYIADKTFLYAFDPAHAIVALPIEVLKTVLSHARINLGPNADGDAQRFFRSLFSDRAGPLTELIALLRIKP